MVTIRNETFRDINARDELLDRVWGASRLQKTAERLREHRAPAKGLSLIAEQDDTIIGTVRLWHVAAGPNRPALLLGPLAIEGAWRCSGIGSALMRRALGAARRRGHEAVILVGDEPYYGRFGFSPAKTGALWLPGPCERHRLLGCEIVPGALDGARGLISATGNPVPKPSFDALTANLAGRIRRPGMRPKKSFESPREQRI
jgi:predicted N-acetyltransferase YhbS